MAYLWIQEKRGNRYYYIKESRRRGERVLSKVLEYLGREPEPVRLRRALRYWRVKTRTKKPAKGEA